MGFNFDGPQLAVRPDNMPGTAGPPPTYVPPPQDPAPTLSPGLTASQRAQAADEYARQRFDAFRHQLPPQELPTRAREFAPTAAAVAADAALDDLRARRDEIGSQIDAQRAGLGVPLTTEGQVFAQRVMARNTPVWDRMDASKAASAIVDAIRQADPNTFAVLADDAAAYLQSRGLDDAAAILEPAIRSRLGLDQLAAAHQNISKSVMVHEQNQRSRHNAYLKGVMPSPPISAAAYDIDAQ